MHKVKIYQPAKTAMQSGRAKTLRWKLEYDQLRGDYVEPLMGWVGQRDTQQQVHLFFDTKEQAIEYAQDHRLDYCVVEPHQRKIKPKSYSSNFSYHQVRKTS